jgi:hypothetical protein
MTVYAIKLADRSFLKRNDHPRIIENGWEWFVSYFIEAVLRQNERCYLHKIRYSQKICRDTLCFFNLKSLKIERATITPLKISFRTLNRHRWIWSQRSSRKAQDTQREQRSQDRSIYARFNIFVQFRLLRPQGVHSDYKFISIALISRSRIAAIDLSIIQSKRLDRISKRNAQFSWAVCICTKHTMFVVPQNFGLLGWSWRELRRQLFLSVSDRFLHNPGFFRKASGKCRTSKSAGRKSFLV